MYALIYLSLITTDCMASTLNQSSVGSEPDIGDVRLSDGCSGELEVYSNPLNREGWYSVCATTSGFQDTETQVVCKQLGCPVNGATYTYRYVAMYINVCTMTSSKIKGTAVMYTKKTTVCPLCILWSWFMAVIYYTLEHSCHIKWASCVGPWIQAVSGYSTRYLDYGLFKLHDQGGLKLLSLVSWFKCPSFTYNSSVSYTLTTNIMELGGGSGQ